MNRLASAVASYTPSQPITEAQGEAIREKISAALHHIAADVDDYLTSLPEASGEELLPEEEQVVIITSPPP